MITGGIFGTLLNASLMSSLLLLFVGCLYLLHFVGVGSNSTASEADADGNGALKHDNDSLATTSAKGENENEKVEDEGAHANKEHVVKDENNDDEQDDKPTKKDDNATKVEVGMEICHTDPPYRGSTTHHPMMAMCAACGKGSNDLKTCVACMAVKYCGVICQKAHRPSHKKECKQLAREIFDEALFKQPVPEECPICFLPLPLSPVETQYQACCGKIICQGCLHCMLSVESSNCPCPFCRIPYPPSEKEALRKLYQRIDIDDPEAYFVLGGQYFCGQKGLKKNKKKALELWQRACELGSLEAHYIVGQFEEAENVEKAKYHYEYSAKGGYVMARKSLGFLEMRIGNIDRATKHWLIAASSGSVIALNKIREGFVEGFVTKDEFETVLRAHKDSTDEMKSDQRDIAREYYGFPTVESRLKAEMKYAKTR